MTFALVKKYARFLTPQMRRSGLAILICASLFSTYIPPRDFAWGSVSSLKSKAAAARMQAAAKDNEAAALKKEVAQLDAEAENYAKQAAGYDSAIAKASRNAGRLTAELSALKTQKVELTSQIASTTAEYRTQQKQLSSRVVQSYKQGSDYFLDLLFGSSDMGDFITRAEFANRILTSNSETAAGLALSKRKLDNNKIQLDKIVESAQNKTDEAVRTATDLKQLKASRQNSALGAQQAQDQKTTLMQNAQGDATKLRALAEEEEATAARLASQLKGNGSGVFHGSMTWPIPASHRVTSNFGPRICPYHGRELHTGVDIGAPSGSTILAAASGTVISAGYRGGYGNTVIIDHGNGVTTLYAHQRSGGIKVSVGQKVRAGQRIGTVGSTGNSTGPHCHWEVRVNGTPKNPLSY
ncbi:MAG: peptidoglycan DD-metalloendopeptidase family protein [Coriobacteriia bacterium]|nr:peptidoglycan DD-metalloendopeptidase family protein [Coriobacteriia bacterium]